MSGPRAIILDGSGVILDDELTEEEYQRDYLALDDRGAFAAVLRKMGRPVTEPVLADLIRHKGILYRARMRDEHRLFPGVADFLRAQTAEGLWRAATDGAPGVGGRRRGR